MRPINWKTVMWLGLSAAAGLAMSYAIGFDPIRISVDKEAGQIWPAWVQAVSSIVALIVAFAVPSSVYMKERRERDDDRRRSAMATALKIMPIADEFRGSLIHALKSMTDGSTSSEDEIPIDPLKADIERLTLLTEDIKQLGTSGELLMESMAKAQRGVQLIQDWIFFKQFTDNGYFVHDCTGEQFTYDEPELISPHFEKAFKAAESSAETMQKLFFK